MEVSDMAVTVAPEGVEPMEDVEEMKVAPTGLTTRHDDGGKDGQRRRRRLTSARMSTATTKTPFERRSRIPQEGETLLVKAKSQR
jgi:hypothetical protein